MRIEFIKKRSGEIVPFELERIQNAITKAYEANPGEDKSDIPYIVEETLKEILENQKKLSEGEFVEVEEIQDSIEKSLMKFNRHKIARSFILYREKRRIERDRQHEIAVVKLYSDELQVIKNNGDKELFDMSKIKLTYRLASKGLETFCPRHIFRENFGNYIIDNIKTNDITKLMIKTATDLISIENTKREIVAGRIFTLSLYKQASRNRGLKFDEIYTAQSYKNLFDDYLARGLYYKDFYKYYTPEEILKAGEHISREQDFTYNHTTITALNKRYLLNPNKIIMELPQEMFMSTALFLAIPESPETRLKTAIKIYEYSCQQKISYPTPTLLNSRTNFHQLSSCFKMNIDDDLRAIYHGIENMAQISKYSGGIGVYLGHIRSRGGYIRGQIGASGGVLPRIKVINDTAVAVNQLGARLGSISVTIDIWHKDILDFLELQTETGDIRRKSFDIFPAVSIPDLFMQRVLENGNRTLFDPKEIKDKYGKSLENHFDKDFEKFYIELENDKDLTLTQTISAKELFKTYMKSVVETGMPYAFFRDTVNRLNPNSHSGNIYSTQLCVEICQNTSETKFIEETAENGEIAIKYKPGDTVVCNLLSLNLAKINLSDELEISQITETAARILDNVITMNFYPIKEAELTAMKYRSVGLGYLGLAEYLAVNKISYDSSEAIEKVDQIFENLSYHFLQASNLLSKERGHYDLFSGSDYSKGIIFGKDKTRFLDNSYLKEKWTILIDEIQKTGVRFGYHFAPAPNTSSSSVVGTTAGLLPVYKKIFTETNRFSSNVRVAPGLTKENFRFYKEYVNMDMNKVIDLISTIYKRIDQSISFERMINPERITPKDLFDYYFKAWRQGIKTVYYVRSLSMDVKECVSCSG